MFTAFFCSNTICAASLGCAGGSVALQMAIAIAMAKVLCKVSSETSVSRGFGRPPYVKWTTTREIFNSTSGFLCVAEL